VYEGDDAENYISLHVKERPAVRKMYELELKARLYKGQKEHIQEAVTALFECSWDSCIYHDTYFDTANRDFAISERELRLRKILTGSQETILITYKEPPFDEPSKSKNEHEITVNSYDEADTILKHLGFINDVSLNKCCQVTQIQYCSYNVNITLTDIVELSDTFMEIEVLTPTLDNKEAIFPILHELLTLLKVSNEQLSNEYYTDMVRNHPGEEIL